MSHLNARLRLVLAGATQMAAPEIEALVSRAVAITGASTPFRSAAVNVPSIDPQPRGDDALDHADAPMRAATARTSGVPIVTTSAATTPVAKLKPVAAASRRARPANGTWTSVAEAAAILGFGVVSLRRLIERHARRAPDGGTEVSVDGIRARKIGRSWRVQLGPAWAAPSSGSQRGAPVVSPSRGSARHGGNE